MRRLIPPTDLLDATIAQAAARHGFRFIDPRAAFRYHSECDNDPWLNHLLTHEMTSRGHVVRRRDEGRRSLAACTAIGL
jgi:hypothetical protein